MGYVYLIGTPIYGWYKIGKSKTPEVRIRDLGILLPFKISVFRVWKAENHSLMESSLHEMYQGNRINGEWFQFTKKQVLEMINRIPAEVIQEESLDKFSNVDQDFKQADGAKYSGKVLGVRIQKLRGNFTLEEREVLRQTSMENKRLKKLEKDALKAV